MKGARILATAIRPACLSTALILLLPGSLDCQAPRQGSRPEAKVLYLDSRPLLRVTLRAGEKAYPCHLLLDLCLRLPLLLHPNAAGMLGASQVELETGSIHLRQLPVVARRDRWMERLTAEHAVGLRQLPVAGLIGPPAFAAYTLVLDGPKARLRLLPRSSGADTPPEGPGLAVLDLRGDPDEEGIAVTVELGTGRQPRPARFILHTREPWSFIRPDLAMALGHQDGCLATAKAGTLNLAAHTPFWPRAVGPWEGGIGAAILEQMVLTLALSQKRLILEHEKPGPYPEDQARYLRARYAAKPISALEKFLAEEKEKEKESPFRLQAARALLEQLLDQLLARDLARDLDSQTVQHLGLAARAAMQAVAAGRRGQEALRILKALPERESLVALRREICSQALRQIALEQESSSGPLLRLELARIARRRGEFREARRHLLAAVFSMPQSGPLNLEMGKVYEAMGQLERARSRYFLAVLDAPETGEEGYLALLAVQQKIRKQPGQDLTTLLLEMAEGRVPALHPIPREPEEITPSGRVVLLELFTGAHCDPCVAADVAFDALSEFYGTDEVAIIQWHLPVPAPEPLVADASQERARSLGIRATPTAVFGGGARVRGGGPAAKATEMFRRYKKEIAALAKAAPRAHIEASAWLEAGKIQLRASFTVVEKGLPARLRLRLRLHAVVCERLLLYPGRNRVLFHRHVARARMPLADRRGTGTIEGSLALAAIEAQLEIGLLALEGEKPFRIRPTHLDPKALCLVLFLQDEPSGEVIQAKTLALALDQKTEK